MIKTNGARWFLLGLCLITGGFAAGNPVASFTMSQSTGCAPLNVQFNNTSTGAVSYSWSMGNGNTSVLVNPSNTYTVPGTYTVTLIATSSSGATATSTAAVTVVGKPSADFSSSQTSSCLDNNSFSFSNNSTGAVRYLWDFGDGTTDSTANPVHTYSISGSFTVTLIATSIHGCQDVKIRNQYITIQPKPDASVSSNTTYGCDVSTVFQFSTANSGITSWNWHFGDGTYSSSPNPSHQYASNGNYYVSVILVNSLGCRDTTDSPLLVSIGPGFYPSIGVNNDTGCVPMSITFTNPNSNIASCLWDFGDGNTSTQFAPSHTYVNPGLYTVRVSLVTTDGCTVNIFRNNMILAAEKPTASFMTTNSTGCAPLAVSFMNTSQNYDSCRWLFGDGSVSFLRNPSHSYSSSGSFDVTLQCWNAAGCSKTVVLQNHVNVTTTQAAFTADQRMGCPPLTVNFTSITQANDLSYLWNFGDGTTSTLQDPSHTYTTSGAFHVSLIVSDSIGCSDTLYRTNYIQTINPSAGYVTPPTTVGCAPLTTQFTDATFGAVTWLWDFGDGTTSTEQNPVHTYRSPGFYNVSLTTTSAGGGCVQTISNFSSFDVRGGHAGFTHTVTPCPPYEATFTDTSMNAVSWLWNFGDGTTSTLQNPAHTYSVPGYHSVTLTITTADGCTYTTMQNNSVYFPPFGANFYGIPQDTTFPMPVQFMSNSVGATDWFWDFGDGNTSTLENPLHTYQAYGNYNVTLMITNGLCTLFYDPPPFNFGEPDTTPVDIGSAGEPEVQQGCAPLSVNFSKTYPGASTWEWDFGDGSSSTQAYPVHTYHRPGIYTVTVTITDTLGIVTHIRMDSIVRVSGPKAGFMIIESGICHSGQVTFIDTSYNATSWQWNFGDSTTSSVQSPVHTYVSGMSNYIITQTVSDTMGCTSSISTSIFSSTQAPLLVTETDVCGLDTLHFFTSLRNYASYVWHFGDGDSSTVANPTHIYTREGIFTPTLTITDGAGCQEVYTAPPVTVNLPRAEFTTNSPRHGCNRLNVLFSDRSSNADLYQWDFGDGNASTLQNSFNSYIGAGVYDVTLTIYRGNCVSRVTEQQYIRVDTAFAEFTWDPAPICVPFSMQYRDLSVNPVSWSWDFGHGTTSTLQNPTHIWNDTNSAWVRLTMTDINGCVDTVVHNPPAMLNADFTPDIDSGCVPVTVNFDNLSTMGVSYFWDFGDGNTSTEEAPTHVYHNPGLYDVTLVVNAGPSYGFCTDTIHMPALIRAVRPSAEFVSPDLYACAPSLVNFQDLSIDADSYIWDFGDSTTSTNADPSHIYNEPGLYTVSLIVTSNTGCSDTLVKRDYIRVLGPKTEFSADRFEGCAPFQVNFTDLSRDCVSWSWSFGDGYDQSAQNPTHVYQDTGVFTVSLITTDTAGCSSYYEHPHKIIVRPQPVAGFSAPSLSGCQPFTASFTNNSQSYTSLLWQFDDGDTSSIENPVHTYPMPGSYSVSLIAWNSYGCTDTAHLASPVEVLATPVANFTAANRNGCPPFHAQFFNTSSNTSGTSYLWDFGNGQTSTNENPQATYNFPGFYTVSLQVTNANGCGHDTTFPAYIQVYDTVPPTESKIYSVSVVSNSTVDITWENNPAIDLGAYILYRLNRNTNQYEIIHTETNIQNTNFALTSTYTDTGLNTLRNTYTYKLQATDICGNTIPLDRLTAHTTINVSSQPAGTDIDVRWTPYGGCPVATYEIYRCTPGEPMQYIATVDGSVQAYLDTTFECPFPYSYRVLATDLCGTTYTSYSDTSQTIPLNIFEGQVVDVIRSTVVDNSYVLTEWKQPTVLPEKVAQFDIYRSTDNQNFRYVASVPAQQTDFSDHQVNVQADQYFYKIQVVNTCNITQELSPNTSTIVLKGEMDDSRHVWLRWTSYIGWDLGVEYFVLEKKDENGNWIFLQQVDGETTQFDYQE